MKPHVRAAVAAAAISHSLGRTVSSIYDYKKSAYRMIDAKVNGARLEGYDYDNSAHFDGTLPNLYHYGESSFVELTPQGQGKYSGYDFGSSCFFEITVKPSGEAEVYDFGASGFFFYST